MLKSMTAYGRSTLVSTVGRFVAEVQSVNRKHLEINTFLPKEFLRYDADIKKWVTAHVGRGQVNIKIWAFFDDSSPLVVRPNIHLAKQIKAAWDAIACELGEKLDHRLSLEILTRETGLLLYDEDLHDEAAYRQALQQVIGDSLGQLMEMKKREGEFLYKDIAERVEKLRFYIKEVAIKAPAATSKYRQRLIDRLKDLMEVTEELQERILREICLFAEKIDITEELTRFDSHLKQVDLLLNTDSLGVGKTLEFLVQELNREINTISAKSSDIDVSRFVIEIKSELERIREQIQNIE